MENAKKYGLRIDGTVVSGLFVESATAAIAVLTTQAAVRP